MGAPRTAYAYGKARCYCGGKVHATVTLATYRDDSKKGQMWASFPSFRNTGCLYTAKAIQQLSDIQECGPEWFNLHIIADNPFSQMWDRIPAIKKVPPDDSRVSCYATPWLAWLDALGIAHIRQQYNESTWTLFGDCLLDQRRQTTLL